MSPRSITRKGTSGIAIVWGDGSEVFLSSEVLRKNCPSAESKAQAGDTTHDKPLVGGNKPSGLAVVQHSREESLTLLKIWPVGQYALGMEWADGHKSGIYPFPLLRELGQMVEKA